MNGERVGTWTAVGRGDHRFEYDASWLESPQRRPISLSMPLRPPSQPYRGDRVLAYFDNLLPDNDEIRRRMMSRFQVDADDPFGLLAEVGRECVGAVQLLRPDEAPQGVNDIRGAELADAEVEELLEAAGGGPALHQALEDFRISLAGNQDKTALLKYRGRWHRPIGTTPTTHILKLPIDAATPGGIDLSSSVENEWLCARILRAFGVPVAHSEMAAFGRQKALVVERFDRVMAEDESWLLRLPQEDFCQVAALPQSRKYESDGGPGVREILGVLRGSRRALEDREDFLRTQFIFWLLCATDGHAKNFSVFLEAGATYRLTPRYDVLSAHPFLGHGSGRLAPQKVKMAMAISGKNKHYRWREIRLEHFLKTAHASGVPNDGRELFAEVIARAPGAVTEVADALPNGFPREVSEPILEGVIAAAKAATAGTAPSVVA